MGTTNYNFTTIQGTDPINLVNAINTPLQEIDTKLKEISDSGANVNALVKRVEALEAENEKLIKGTTYDDLSTNGFVYKKGE